MNVRARPAFVPLMRRVLIAAIPLFVILATLSCGGQRHRVMTADHVGKTGEEYELRLSVEENDPDATSSTEYCLRVAVVDWPGASHTKCVEWDGHSPAIMFHPYGANSGADQRKFQWRNIAAGVVPHDVTDVVLHYNERSFEIGAVLLEGARPDDPRVWIVDRLPVATNNPDFTELRLFEARVEVVPPPD